MKMIVDQLEELAVTDFSAMEATGLRRWLEEDSEHSRRSTAWELVAERATPAGLRFRW